MFCQDVSLGLHLGARALVLCVARPHSSAWSLVWERRLHFKLCDLESCHQNYSRVKTVCVFCLRGLAPFSGLETKLHILTFFLIAEPTLVKISSAPARENEASDSYV